MGYFCFLEIFQGVHVSIFVDLESGMTFEPFWIIICHIYIYDNRMPIRHVALHRAATCWQLADLFWCCDATRNWWLLIGMFVPEVRLWRLLWGSHGQLFHPQYCHYHAARLHSANCVFRLFHCCWAFFHLDLLRREPNNQWNFVD